MQQCYWRGLLEECFQRNSLKINGFTGGNYVSGDFGAIDDLQYEYNGKNQVTRITDNAETSGGLRARVNTKGFVYNFDAAFLDEHYKYDANGNLTYDAHKAITNIEYNYMNLPARILLEGDRTITFLYDATGRKLRKTVTGNGQQEQRDYLDGIEYKDGKPDQFLHSEGTVRADEKGQFRYYFVLRDHLGNTRVTFSDLNNDDKVSEKEDIIQINNYYAFGINMEGNWNGKDGANKYQYNEKELHDDFGLGWNDYDTRFYDPAMARFQTIDILADDYSFQTPYAYAANNPIRYRDFMGMNPEQNCNCLTEKQLMSNVRMQGLRFTSNLDQHGDNPIPPQPQQRSGTPTADPSTSSKGTPMESFTSGSSESDNSDLSNDVQEPGDPTDPPKPVLAGYAESISLGWAGIWGYGIEFGRVYDQYNNWRFFFRRDIRIGFGIDVSFGTTQIFAQPNKPFTPLSYAGYDFSTTTALGLVSFTHGGNTSTFGSHKGSRWGGERYGSDYITKSMSLEPIGIWQSILKRSLIPKGPIGIGYFRTYGVTTVW